MPVKKAKKQSKDTLVDKVVLLGSSLVYLTKGATDELIAVLERNDIVSTKEGKEAVEKVKVQLDARKSAVQKSVVKQLGKVIDQLGLATKEDLKKLAKNQSITK